MTSTNSPINCNTRRKRQLLVLLACGAATWGTNAQDWEGAFTLTPASAPDMALEAVGSGTTAGTIVSIGHPTGAANQQWVITPKGQALYAIKPAYSATLRLAVAQGGTNNGTAIVLETDQGQAWQVWSIQRNDNGTFSLLPKHAPTKGLDDLGGRGDPGAKQDLWAYHPTDEHLQWLLKPLAGAKFPAAATNTIPHGVVTNMTFTSSVIFPGTERALSVFIPAQYDGSKPACVYVKFDGYNAREKTLLEALIATQAMPVTIGIFVKPGTLPPPMPGTLGRRNRCFEYDGVGDNNVRFLLEEILPFVAKECGLNLSTNGNDRCLAGGSSGGIAAFNTAWERPDAFSRVYANSGSFVAFRGGHEFPTLVRKFETKPIRAYLTTGTNDMKNCAGEWFLLDQEMDKALSFAGYDYFFRIINGGHVAGYYDYFAEAMTFLWKDWPQPIQAKSSAPRVCDVLLPDENWQLAAQGLHDARGATCNASGEVFFVDVPRNAILRLGEGPAQVWRDDAGHANSLSFGPHGELFAASSATGKILSYPPEGPAREVISDLRGQHLLARPDGGLYVTCAGAQPAEGGTVWFVKDGRKTCVDHGLKRATGLAYRPDQWLLAVADGSSKWVYSYQLNPDGTLINKERFFWLHVPDWEDDAGAEALCYAKEGQLFVATHAGIQVCTDDGPTQVILPMPDRSRVFGVCLGGREMDTLFAFCGDKIWKRKVKVHAFGAFSPWTKVNGGRL